MPDILIHRCTLRVVRRDGWSWGPNRKNLLDQIVRIFPALLAKKLAELFPSDEDREITSPITIRLPIRFSDFGVSEHTVSTTSPRGESSPSSALEARIATALRNTFGISEPPKQPATRAEPAAAQLLESLHEFSPLNRKHREPLQRLLSQWHQLGILSHILAEFSPAELDAWHEALQPFATPSTAPTPAELSASVADLTNFLLPKLPSPIPSDRATRLRQRILLAIEAAAQFQISPAAHSLWQLLNHLSPANNPTFAVQTPLLRSLPAEIHPDSEEILRSVTPLALNSGIVNLQHPEIPPCSSADEWDVHVECALPFLTLAPLTALGYFDAMAAILQAAKINNAAHLFAASLAYKILGPPQRGWLRSPAALASATAFAGQPNPLQEADLVELARQVDPYLGLLDRLIANSLIAGHTTGQPLLLCRADFAGNSGYLLADTQGCFPISRGREVASFLPLLARIAEPLLLISREATDPALLESLDRAGISFVLDVPPIREERWQRIPHGPATNVWTNHPVLSSPGVLRAALQIAPASEEAAALWRELGVSRISAIRAVSTTLEQTQTLAAAAALGAIAWKLWRERGRTTPQLALERFADLDAHIHFGAESVQVRLPLGRRHRELFERGLLSPIKDLPWFGGRRVEFSGG